MSSAATPRTQRLCARLSCLVPSFERRTSALNQGSGFALWWWFGVHRHYPESGQCPLFSSQWVDECTFRTVIFVDEDSGSSLTWPNDSFTQLILSDLSRRFVGSAYLPRLNDGERFVHPFVLIGSLPNWEGATFWNRCRESRRWLCVSFVNWTWHPESGYKVLPMASRIATPSLFRSPVHWNGAVVCLVDDSPLPCSSKGALNQGVPVLPWKTLNQKQRLKMDKNRRTSETLIDYFFAYIYAI